MTLRCGDNAFTVSDETRQPADVTQRGTRREPLGVLGVDPFTGKPRPIQLDYDKLKGLPRKGAGKIKEAAYVVLEVLARPAAIFRGLKRDADDPRHEAGWLCYVGRPARCFEDDGREIPPPPARVFLVFVTEAWIAYNWYWCEADADRADLPNGYAERFREKLL